MTAVDPAGRIRHPLDVFHSTFNPDGTNVAAGMVPVADGLGQVEYVDSTTLGGSGGDVWDIPTQAARAGRFLMEDGSWRDPLVTGTGVLSVGSTVTITDDTKYNAWPTICWMQDGHLLAVYTKGDSHHADNTGKAVCKVGTLALDGTISWGSEITVYDHASLWVSAQGVASISTGRVFVSVWRDDFASSPSGVAGLVYSDDFGVTWSSFITLSSTFTQESFTAGPVIELRNGDLLVPIEGTVSGTAANRSSHALRSTDQGLTWGSEVTLRNYATDSRPYYETNLILLQDLTILAIHRTSGGTGTHYTQTSTDGGATWSTPASAFYGYGAPGVIQASTRSIIVITRKNSDASVIAFVSLDGGSTWDSGTSIATGMTESEYGKAVELPDGRLFVIFGSQPSGSTTNSDIKGTFVTEGTTTAGAGVTSVALTVPAEFSVSGSPVTSSGTLAISKATEAANTVWAGPTSGSAAQPTFRALVAADIPSGVGTTDHQHVMDVLMNGDGSTTAFELPAAPFDAYSVAAYVAGVLTEVTLSGTLLTTATFGSAPGSGTNNIRFDIVAAAA